MEGKLEQENRKEELKRKFTELLNDYTEEPAIPLTRKEREALGESVGGSSLIPEYEKSKFRRSWLTSVHSYFDIGEMWSVEPEFFQNKKEEMKKLLPFFAASKEELEAQTEKVKELRESNEFDVTPEIIEKTNQMLREAIKKLS